MEKRYKIIKDCFVGNIGDVITKWNGMDGTCWTNHTKNTTGCPFVEFDCIKEIKTGDFVITNMDGGVIYIDEETNKIELDNNVNTYVIEIEDIMEAF